MSAILLDGEAVAARIKAEVADRVARLRRRGGHVGLGTILVGDDVPSARYVAMKHEDCASLGMLLGGEHLPATATQAEVLEPSPLQRRPRSRAPSWSSCLCRTGLDEEPALLAVDPAKDVDGLHPVNLGRLVLGTPGPAALHPLRDRRAAARLRRPRRRPSRRDHRARA